MAVSVISEDEMPTLCQMTSLKIEKSSEGVT